MIMDKIKYDVYICCSTKDAEIAKDICGYLEANGIRCWIANRDIGIGELWAEKIREAIRNSSVFMILCSAHCYHSSECSNELGLASNLLKPILAIMLDKAEMEAEFLYYLRPQNGIDYTSHDCQPNILKAVGSILKEQHPLSPNTIQLNDNTQKDGQNWIVRSLSVTKNMTKDATIKLASIIPCKVYIDGVFGGELKRREIAHIPVDFGSYIVSIEAPDMSAIYSVMTVDVNKDQPTKAIVPNLPRNLASLKEIDYNQRQELKCFIAGSKSMIAERDKMRAVVSNMYVNWKSRNMLIEVYSFDNFQHTMSEIGHQEEYNQFIQNKADLVLFLFDTSVGDITLQELDIAIKTYKSSERPKRPKIIIYVKKYNDTTEVIDSLKERLKKEDMYWVDYETIEDLGLAFEKDLNDFLFKKVMVEPINNFS